MLPEHERSLLEIYRKNRTHYALASRHSVAVDASVPLRVPGAAADAAGVAQQTVRAVVGLGAVHTAKRPRRRGHKSIRTVAKAVLW